MLFNSYIYILIFLPLVAATYYVAGSRLHRKLSIAWLVIASLFFYGWWNPIYLLLIIGSSVFNFGLGSVLSGDWKKGRKLPVLVAGITINLLLLGYFKYAYFFIENVNFSLGTDIEIAPIFLPLAISFFTFQQISFLLDAYRGGIKDYSFIHYMLFVTFFPQLIAGPIVHHAEMMPQFDQDETYKPRRRNIEIGLSIFVVGLFKKVMLADFFATYSSPVFQAVDAGITLSMTEYWLGSAAFALQLYFDFSGYSDMAIGSARLFGIKLPINFYSPFKAENTAQLWRRWHMTLTRFATVYIFMPMNISRGRTAIKNGLSEQKKFWSSVAYPLIVTFLAVGIWHGAGWNFAIWGLLQGVCIVINNLWQQFRRNTLKHNLTETTRLGRCVARGVTLAAAIYSLVFFKAATTAGAMTMAWGMLGLDGIAFDTTIIPSHSLLYIAGGFAITLLLPNTQQLFIDYEPSLEPRRKETLWGLDRIKWAPDWSWATLCSAMLIAAIFNMSKVSEFIYFQF
jgi:alginate O-acetyltransferase complex protein AlgI